MQSSIETLRSRHIQQLEWAIPIYKIILSSMSDSDIITKRDGGDGWTALEVICHMRDYEQIVIKRAILTLNEDNATMPGINPAQVAIDDHYNEQDLATVFDEWTASRAEYVALQSGTTSDQWQRTGHHAKHGLLTVTDQLMMTVWHDMLHMEQLRKIINGV